MLLLESSIDTLMFLMKLKHKKEKIEGRDCSRNNKMQFHRNSII